jgi:hypothetical protein
MSTRIPKLLWPVFAGVSLVCANCARIDCGTRKPPSVPECHIPLGYGTGTAAPTLPMVKPSRKPPQIREDDDDADTSRRRRASITSVTSVTGYASELDADEPPGRPPARPSTAFRGRVRACWDRTVAGRHRQSNGFLLMQPRLKRRG